MPQGFLLHSRPYRETSLIATFLTDTAGRQDLLLRSVRQSAKKMKLMPQAFCCYELAWAGRGELKQVQWIEALSSAIVLQGDRLFCGFYINELLYRLLSQHEAEAAHFELYAQTLASLCCEPDIEPVLRHFELSLLELLGYGLSLDCDTNGHPLQEDGMYCYVPEQGLVALGESGNAAMIAGSGAAFFATARRDFSLRETRQLAKRLLRVVLSMYLGGRPLRSRELFVGN